MELAYQESAFTKPQLEKFDRAAVAKADITDLRMFTGCNYFLANESFNSYLTFYHQESCNTNGNCFLFH